MEIQNETKEVAQIILHAVDTVQYGKHKLACFLKGSRSKEIIPKMQENVFGGLLWYNISTIEGFIEQLETMGFLERKEKPGYPYPFSVYALTDAGRKVIDEKMNIPLQEIKKEKPITIGDSERQTLELFRQGKNASDIAKVRDLAESTIYTHFYRLIVNGHLSSSEIIPEDVHKSITEACSGFEKKPSLKEIKEQLLEGISYDQIRCVAADFYGEKNAS
jgi:DNA-binding MarR family transcriptional regulator